MHHARKKSLSVKLKTVLYALVEGALRNIAGGLGQRLRYAYYSKRFRRCGKGVKIDEGVIFVNPESIEVGNKVWFLPYSIITGRGGDVIPPERILKQRGQTAGVAPEDIFLKIGDQTSIGAYNIIHGYGGLTIGRRVTTSARVSVYSFSHMPNDPASPSTITYANSMVDDAPVACIASPIVLEDGVWLGLNASIFGGTLGENCFVEANSVVMGDLPANTCAGGQPATPKGRRFAVGPGL